MSMFFYELKQMLDLSKDVWSGFCVLPTYLEIGDGEGGGAGGSHALSPPKKILADQLTLFKPGKADSVHHINTRPNRFSGDGQF